MTLITQYDTIDPTQVPSNAVAVAGYVGGSWPDYSELVARFPHARHKSIAISASEDADILDIESGDAVPSQAPEWFRRQKARGLEKPGIYTSESNMSTVISIMTASGIPESAYVRWMAWLGSPTLPGGVQARQYTFNALGRDLDASVCDPSFWSSSPSPPVKNDFHYERFATGPFLLNRVKLDERSVVEQYDKYRALQTPNKHPHKAQLALLRLRLRWLARRVYSVAHSQTRKGRPSWGVDYRGWRYQQLIHRAQGQRFH